MIESNVNCTALVQPAKQLDEAAASHLRERLVCLLAEGPRNLVIDLGHVTSIDVSGLAVLLSGLILSRRSNGSLSLIWPTDRTAGETLRRAAFGDIFDLVQSREVAVRELSLQ